MLVDDVLYTGRIVRAALNELYDYGRLVAVELAALADHGERRLPSDGALRGSTLEVPAEAALVQVADADLHCMFELEAR